MSEKVQSMSESEDVSILGYQNQSTNNIQANQIDLDDIQQQQQQENISNVHYNNNSRVENMIGLVTHQIQDQIQKESIIVSDQTKPFKVNQSSNNHQKFDSENIDEKKIAQYVKKRKSLQQEMTRLKLEQSEEKRKIRSKSTFQDTHHKPFRSQFTEEQHMQISRIKKEVQQFQNRLDLKDKEIIKNQQQERKKQAQQQREFLLKLKQRKKQQAQRNIQKMHQQQKQRLQRLKQQNKKYQQVKKGKSLHQKIEQYHKHLEQLRLQKQKQLLNKKRKQMLVDFEDIKKHQKQYYEAIKLQKQKIQQQLAEKAKQMKKVKKQMNHTYRPSTFLNTIFKQQQKKHEQDRSKIQQIKNLFNRRNSYQQKLRDLHKQLIKSKPKPPAAKSPVQIKSQQRRLKAKSMSAADIYKQGQQYMKSIHGNINPIIVEQSKVQLQNQYKQLKEGSRTQYKDYLQQSKIRRQFFYKSTGRLRENPEINQLRQLIQTKDTRNNQNLIKAKLIAQKLDQKTKNSSTRAMVNSIAAKLKIIEEFS